MSYKIPLFDLNFDHEEEKAVIEVLRSGWISSGPKVQAFEEKFARLIGAGHAVAVSNCTVALHMAMILTGIKAGDEVICPSLTFVATCNAIRYVNAIPVFADIAGYDDLNIDPADIERKITPATSAIVVMHFGGFPCDMDRIMDLARRYDLRVIEDACHGPLSGYKGKKLGTIGDIGCFSFFSNKNISTGEGGMLVTNDDAFSERARLLRSHGMTSMSYDRSKGHSTSYDVIDLGYNYRMDDIHASLGLVQLGKIQADIQKRAEIRERYLDLLKDRDDIIIPFAGSEAFSSNYVFTIVLKDPNAGKRDLVRQKLAEAGIQTSVHYPAVHRFSIYREFSCHLPLTEYVSDNLITLPMYSRLDDADLNYITLQLKRILND